MLSRDTYVHIVAIIVGVGLFALAEFTEVWTGSRRVALALSLLGYAVVLGGAHFYLALRGEDGMVPVESRVRYLGMLAILFVTAGVVLLFGGSEVAGVGIEAIGVVVAVATLVGYVYLESREGYRG